MASGFDRRDFVASIVLAAMFLGTFETHYVRSLWTDADRARSFFMSLPYRKTPGLRQFAVEIEARTSPGDAIAFWGPGRGWGEGYGYAFMRIAYLLPDRRFLALVDRQNRLHPENLEAVTWIVSWQGEPAVPGFRPVWRGEGGALWRKSP